MISRIHNKLGTAGFVVAIVALIAALGGAAIAAAPKLNSTQKKEVKKIAQTEAKKIVPAVGPPGATGATGVAGPKGDTGATGQEGPEGEEGPPGANGKNVVIGAPTPAECLEGGATVQVEGSPATKKAVCKGEPWTAGGTLPPGETLTGIIGGGVNFTASEVKEPQQISFNLPLTAAPTVNLIQKNGTANPGSLENCPGNVNAPAADPGNLCVWVDPDEEISIGNPTLSNIKPYTTGAVIQVNYPGFSSLIGTWAVTAPTS